MLSYSLKTGLKSRDHLILFCLLGLILSTFRVAATQSAAVALAWDRSADTSVTGYRVYYGTTSGTYTNVVPAGNATTATVSNLASGMTYYFAATTYTSAGLESDYSGEASYAVPSANAAPTLNVINDLIVNQDSPEQSVLLTGISSGSPNEIQTLTISAFSSNPGIVPNPVVSYVSPETDGIILFTPAPGSYGSAIITVMVDDGGSISNTIIRTFMVTVNPANNPPTIDLLSDLAVSENSGQQKINLTGISSGSASPGTTIAVTAVSANPALIPNPTITYVSPSSTAVLTFAPVTNASGTAKITVIVSDNQPTNNSASVSFQITVNQSAPIPGLLATAIVAPNSTFRFAVPAPATNGDRFSMSLAAGAPTGAKMTTRRGVTWLVWTPTMSQASTTNLIGIRIADTSNPALSTNESVQVIVQDYLALVVGSTSLQVGQSGSVPLALSSSEGVTNLTFTVAWPTNALLNPVLSISAPGVASGSLQSQGTSSLVTIQMAAGQTLTGSNVIGSIRFQASATLPSENISLPLINLTAFKPSAVAYSTAFPTAGNVAVINNLAMLQANYAGGPTRSLTILGKVGNSYQVQYATNFTPTTIWTPLVTYSQTNISQTVVVDPSLPQAFYRVQQK